MPDELRMLWDTLDEEEEVKIIIPDPYPTIDWSKVNKRFVSNIPEPKAFPVQGCSQDPQFYEWSHKKETVHRCGDVFTYKQDVAPGFENGSFPFGYEYGYKTNAGIISVTSTVHHGYTWNGEEGWLLHAQGPNDAEEISKRKNKHKNNNFKQRKFRGKEKPH